MVLQKVETLTNERRAEIDRRYGSQIVGPWSFHKPDERGYVVLSYGGNDIIAVKHYSPVIAKAIVEALIHFPDDIGLLLTEVERLRAALKVMVEHDPERNPIYYSGHDDNRYCYYCTEWDEYSHQQHAPDCPWVKAKALLGP